LPRPRPLTEDERETIRHVLYYYGHPAGWAPGGFTELLLKAYQKADPGNKARLRQGFPEMAEAMDVVMNSMTGIKDLAERLES
jgi:hypothetical protein